MSCRADALIRLERRAPNSWPLISSHRKSPAPQALVNKWWGRRCQGLSHPLYFPFTSNCLMLASRRAFWTRNSVSLSPKPSPSLSLSLALSRALSLSLCKKITHVSMKEKQQTNTQAVWLWYLTRPYLWCRAKAQRLLFFLCRVLLMTALALTKREFDRCITDHISTHTDSLTKTSQCIHIFINMCPHTRTESHTNTPQYIHVYVPRTSDSE